VAEGRDIDGTGGYSECTVGAGKYETKITDNGEKDPIVGGISSPFTQKEV
jgi:hypothetical protein